MILKTNIDLGASFELLKKALKQSKETWDINSLSSMIIANSMLTGTLEGVLGCVEEKETEQDIPDQLFTHAKNETL